MEKKKLIAVGLIGLLMVAGLFLVSCELPGGCPGNGECTVTIGQNASGLYVENGAPRSTCGEGRTYNYDTGEYEAGCKVEDNINDWNRKYGTQSCDC